jgi:hypothetical protein
MRLRHVGRVRGVLPPGVASEVGRHALAAVEDLDGQGAHPDVHRLPERDQGVRDGIVMVSNLDMVIETVARFHSP